MTTVLQNRQQEKISGIKNENGSAIIIALVVLLAVTIMAIATSNNSITELLISGNDVVKKISFFNADAGVFAVPKVISRSVNDRETPFALSPPFTFLDPGVSDTTAGSITFFRELAGFEDYDDTQDIAFQNDDINTTEIDVERLGSFTLVGGGAEFGSGAEGQGTSLKGLRFNMLSTGTGQKNAETIIESRYLKVLGTAGGL